MPPPRHRFLRSRRLTRRADFDAVRRRGRTVRDDVLRLAWLRRDAGPTRLGLAVSARLGNAVARNRMKRVLREAFRLRGAAFPPGLDLVAIPLDPTRAHRYAEVEASLLRLAAKIARETANSDAKGRS